VSDVIASGRRDGAERSVQVCVPSARCGDRGLTPEVGRWLSPARHVENRRPRPSAWCRRKPAAIVRDVIAESGSGTAVTDSLTVSITLQIAALYFNIIIAVLLAATGTMMCA
jgi:hypothetical protein